MVTMHRRKYSTGPNDMAFVFTGIIAAVAVSAFFAGIMVGWLLVR